MAGSIFGFPIVYHVLAELMQRLPILCDLPQLYDGEHLCLVFRGVAKDVQKPGIGQDLDLVGFEAQNPARLKNVDDGWPMAQIEKFGFFRFHNHIQSNSIGSFLVAPGAVRRGLRCVHFAVLSCSSTLVARCDDQRYGRKFRPEATRQARATGGGANCPWLSGVGGRTILLPTSSSNWGGIGAELSRQAPQEVAHLRMSEIDAGEFGCSGFPSC